MFDQITIPQVITWIALAVAIAACAGTVHYARRAEAAARRAQAASERAQKHAKWAHVHTVRAQAASDRALAAASRAEAAAARIPAWGFGAGNGRAGAPSGFGGGTPSPMGEPGRGGGGAVTNRIEFAGTTAPDAINAAIRRQQAARRGVIPLEHRAGLEHVADAVGTTDDAAEADR